MSAKIIKVYLKDGLIVLEADKQAPNKVVGTVDFNVDRGKVRFQTLTPQGMLFGGQTFEWANIQDETGAQLGTDLSTTVTALRAIFFLASGGSFNLDNVFDLTKTERNFFDVTPSGNIVVYPSIAPIFTGIFFKDSITSFEWDRNDDTSNWVILGGTALQFSALTWIYAQQKAIEFINPPGFALYNLIAAPLVDYTSFTRFKLVWTGLLYEFYGYNGTSFVKIMPDVDMSVAPFSSLVGAQTNHQLGIVWGSVSGNKGLVAGNVLLNGSKIVDLL